ncbi:Uncharacterised protein [uncultured archaeon]|nr:Uncharacterised protein [uncultured archaeon]
MRNNNINLKKTFVFLILFILIFNLIAFISADSTTDKKLEDYLTENQGNKDSPGTSKFMELDGEARNNAFNSADDPESRNAMAQQVSLKANEAMIKNVEGSNLMSIVLEQKFNDLYKRLQDSKFDFAKIKDVASLQEAAKSVGVPWKSVEERLHSQLDKNLIDFEENKDHKLEWSKLKDANGKPRNIIGDGKVWLDMDNLPLMTKGIQYRDGKFTLTLEKGGKLVLGDGSTNEKGEINFITNLPEKGVRKFTGEDGKEKYIAGLRQFVSNDPNFVPDLKNFRSSSDNGEVEITKEGFLLKGDGAKIQYGEFSFGRKEGETSPESYAKFYEEGMNLKGTEMKYDSEVKVGSTKTDFIFRPNGDLPASVISFTDKDGKTVWGNFDETGRLTSISKEGVKTGSKDDWVDLKDNKAGFLKTIYDSSGDTVKGLIDDSVAGKRVTLSQVKEKFYSDSDLKKEGKDIIVGSTHSDFLVINAKNYDVGGSGTIQPMHDLTSMRAYDTKDFYVRSGDYYFHLENDELKVPGNPDSKPEISIDKINLLSDNQVISGQKWKLSADATDGKFVSASNRVIEGITSGVVSELTLPSGVKINKPVSVGVTIDINEDDFNKNVKGGVEGVWFSDSQRDAAILGSLKSEMTLRADVIVPLDGVSINGPESADFIDKNVGPAVIRGLFPEEGVPIEGVNRVIMPEVADALKSALVKSAGSIDYIELNKIAVELQNDPTTNTVSLVFISGDKKGTAVPLDQKFGDSTQTLGKDLLEASLRAPDPTKGKIDQYTAYSMSSDSGWFNGKYWTGKPEQYSGPQIRYLFESNLGSGRNGMSSDKWIRMVSEGDGAFFKGTPAGRIYGSAKNGFLDNYFIKVKPKN